MSNTEVNERDFPSPVTAHYALGLLTIAYIFAFVDRQIISLLVEPIRRDLQISDFQISLLQGMAFALFYALLGLPIGRLADRFSRKWIVGASIFFWSLATAACGLSRNFGTLFLARIGVGIGEAGLSPAAYSLLSDYFPPARLARALAIYTMGLTIGGGLAYLVGGAVIELVTAADAVSLPLFGKMQPWQVVFLIVGLPGLLLVPLVGLMKEPRRQGLLQEAGGKDREVVPFAEVLRFVRTNWKIFLPLFGGASLLSVIGYGTLNWYPTFLIRTYGMSVGEIGVQFGVIYMVFGTIGAFGSAMLSEKLAKRGYTDANLRVVMLVGLGMMVPAVLGPLMPTRWMALCFAAPMVMMINAHLGVTAAALQQITPNQMRATISAMMLFVTNILGLGLGAVIIASFTDYVFADDAALRYSLACVGAITCPLAALSLRSALPPFRARLVDMTEILRGSDAPPREHEVPAIPTRPDGASA